MENTHHPTMLALPITNKKSRNTQNNSIKLFKMILIALYNYYRNLPCLSVKKSIANPKIKLKGIITIEYNVE